MRYASLGFFCLLAVLLLTGCGQVVFTPASSAGPPVDDRFIVQPRPEDLIPSYLPFPSTDARLMRLPVPALAFDARYRPMTAPPGLSTASSGAASSAVIVPGVAGPALIPPPEGPAFAWAETENYLILGTDRREGQTNWRTDTIMILGLDRANGRAALLSVPRDFYVNAPYYGYSRINTLDYLGERSQSEPGGGPRLVGDVIYQYLGVPTEHWMRVEMTGFRPLVDAVGGVTLHLDCPFYDTIYSPSTGEEGYFVLPAGDITLTGEEAYWFVRLRTRESDIGRAQRQRQFLWALRDQALSMNLLPRLPELWDAFHQMFSTDLSLLEIGDLARFALSLDAADVRSGGIALGELETYITDEGANVLVIKDADLLRWKVNNIWNEPAMVDAYRQDATACPPLPPDAAALLAGE
ncbi:MAG: LCP family protein [Caldilineaceae bacterium]|nr:LCP family protein [Caldilineaceae bacterium]